MSQAYDSYVLDHYIFSIYFFDELTMIDFGLPDTSVYGPEVDSEPIYIPL